MHGNPNIKKDNTFVIKQLIEKQLSVGKEVHLLFIDLKNVPYSA